MAFLNQLGIAAESAVGTYLAPTRFIEILPGESLDVATTTINSSGLQPGRRYASGARRKKVRHDPRGTLSFEVPTAEFGVWLEHALGTVATVQPDATGAPSVYEHTFTPGSLDGLGLTIQKGVERADGTVIPFALIGSKIASWEISVGADEFAVASFTVEAMDYDDTSALASASYTNPDLFTFAEGTVEIDDGNVAIVKAASVTGQNSLDLDRRFLNAGQTKSEPKENGIRTGGGQIVAEFDTNATIWDRYKADTSAKLELIFVGSVIEGSYSEELHITLNDVRFGGELPKIVDQDVPDLTVPFEYLKPAAGDAISILYRSTDVTP